VVERPVVFLAGHGTAQTYLNGSQISHSAMPADRSFTLAPDWTARMRPEDEHNPIPRVFARSRRREAYRARLRQWAHRRGFKRRRVPRRPSARSLT
jgi:hypothetical protein